MIPEPRETSVPERNNDNGATMSKRDEKLKKVLEVEDEYILKRRDHYKIPAWNAGEIKNRVGLALSGGGIRSATFNLGILQGLAEKKILHGFDYLSTVSGGGYIGSCFTSLLTDTAAISDKFDAKENFPLKASPGNPYLQHLRQSSNFLAPRHGPFSLDSWRLVAAYLRGLIVSHTILLPALLALFICLRWVILALGMGGAPVAEGILRAFQWMIPGDWAILGLTADFLSVKRVIAGLSSISLLGTCVFLLVSALSGFLWQFFRKEKSLERLETFLACSLWVVIGCGLFALASGGAAWIGFFPSTDPRNVHLLLGALILTVMGFFLNWNYASLHRFYRNHLSKAYLQTNNIDDDGMIVSLRNDDRLLLSEACAGHRAPYHLIQTTLNLQGTSDPRQEGRKADFFLLSPRYCGSQTTEFIPTEIFERNEMSLGSALAISGAAVSPQKGQSTSSMTSFLMTMLNLRMGYWVLNPTFLADAPPPPARLSRRTALRAFVGRFWPFLALADLFRWGSEKWAYVMLSDGGHHENLGLYALLERKCLYIVVSDAGADPKFAFEDLGNVIRKARIDLGVEIDINVAKIKPDPVTGRSGAHAVIGKIHYPGDHANNPIVGTLVYIKASVMRCEPPDILHYKDSHPAFPHEPTSDQFFDEAQFESYRKLGHHIAAVLFSSNGGASSHSGANMDKVFSNVALKV
jgi:hypothetical protein